MRAPRPRLFHDRSGHMRNGTEDTKKCAKIFFENCSSPPIVHRRRITLYLFSLHGPTTTTTTVSNFSNIFLLRELIYRSSDRARPLLLSLQSPPSNSITERCVLPVVLASGPKNPISPGCPLAHVSRMSRGYSRVVSSVTRVPRVMVDIKGGSFA